MRCLKVNIFVCFLVLGHVQKQTSSPPSSINKVRPPMHSNLVTTETFKHIREKIEKEMIMILLCHGVPGSGKSQIVRKLAKEFPFGNHSNETDILIKWHIQCKDSGHNLKEKMKELAEKLLKNLFIENQEKCQSIVDELEENDNSKLLIDVLVNTGVPVLIIVEDPSNEHIALLKDLCASLRDRAKKQKPISKKFHLHISSRKNTVLLEGEANLPFYKVENIKGFNEKEALNYLNRGLVESNSSHDALAVFQFFSGLPLGLNVARAHCNKARMNYKKYLVLVKDVNYDIISKEKEAIIEEYGNSAPHLFQAIVAPFKTEELQLKILRCLSYFHYDRIPSYVLQQCCHLLQTGQGKRFILENEEKVGTLITELLERDMCTETNEHEITFHEVVLNAFRLNNLDMDNSDTLKKSVEIMCSLVSKDLRKKEHSSKMFKLRRHLQTLLDYVENNQQIFDNKSDEPLFRALISYLHETTATVMLSDLPSLFWNECEEHFEKALCVMFPGKICKFSKFPKDNKQSVKHIAREILKMSDSKGSHLPPGFFAKYMSKLKLHFKGQRDEMEFLKSRSTNIQCFANLEDLLSDVVPSEVIIEKLQKCGLILSTKKYRSVFYAERFASILCSWSRLVLFGDSDDVKEIGRRCLWMSSLSHEISIDCRTFHGVALLTEHLSLRDGRIPILLKANKSPKELQYALGVCEEYLKREENADVFENGLLREVNGPSTNDTKVTLLRYIVLINARINASALDKESIEFVKLADRRCEELFKLSEAHAKTTRISIMCFIYCAKYYAIKGDFDQAMKCFDKFFELEPSCEPRFYTRSWAVYNYARAVIKSKNCSPEHIERAFSKCKKVLTEKGLMNKTVKNRLITCMNELNKALETQKPKLEAESKEIVATQKRTQV